MSKKVDKILRMRKLDEKDYKFRVIIQRLDGYYSHQKQWRIKGQEDMLKAIDLLNANKDVFKECLSKQQKYEQFKQKRTVKKVERV